MHCSCPRCRPHGRRRRAQCTNNLKQLGLALANYESANNCLPIGVVYAVNGVSGMPGAICMSPGGANCQNTPWFVLMLPYIEQAPLYNAFNASIGIEGPALLGFVINSTVMTSRIASFQCPSDNIQTFSMAALSKATGGSVPAYPWMLSKGNYGVNWGNLDFGQGVLSPVLTRNLFLQSPFGIAPTGLGPITIRSASFTDGTSNTHVVAELLQGAPDDFRGTIWDSHAGGGSYMTRFAPNGYQDLLPIWLSLSNPGALAGISGALALDNYDNIGSFGPSRPGSSPPNPGSFCDSQPAQMLGCNDQENFLARTRQRGPATPVGSTASLATAPSTSSRTRSTGRPGSSSARSTAARSSAPISIETASGGRQPPVFSLRRADAPARLEQT